MLERKDEFVRGLVTKMLGYALGRGLVNEDFYTVEMIVKRLQEASGKDLEMISYVGTTKMLKI